MLDPRYNVLAGDFSRLPPAFVGAAEHMTRYSMILSLLKSIWTRPEFPANSEYIRVSFMAFCTMVVLSTKPTKRWRKVPISYTVHFFNGRLAEIYLITVNSITIRILLWFRRRRLNGPPIVHQVIQPAWIHLGNG